MTDHPIYHAGMRDLQDRFGTRLLADRLAQHTRREAFTPDDRAFIEGRTFFMLATADAEGFPDCSYKGGAPGYVLVTGPATLAFPSLDGNGMYRSLGNISVNPRVGMLFIDFDAPKRLRVNGRARIAFDDPMIARFPGAELMVHVEAEGIFPNCPRYIHQGSALSPYLDRGDGQTKVPAWKSFPQFADALPRRGQKEPEDG
jgi:predicted pyridoxine 5'-phosphate oxidase superfamily flavin-nucleotide-binding protein